MTYLLKKFNTFLNCFEEFLKRLYHIGQITIVLVILLLAYLIGIFKFSATIKQEEDDENWRDKNSKNRD